MLLYNNQETPFSIVLPKAGWEASCSPVKSLFEAKRLSVQLGVPVDVYNTDQKLVATYDPQTGRFDIVLACDVTLRLI